MADNLTTQNTTLATIPTGTGIATREVTYSGDGSEHIAPVGLVTFAGSDDAKTATDVSTANPLPVIAPGSQTLDYDTGGGTAATEVVGIALAASGGPVGAPGDVTNGLDVDVTRLPSIPAGTAVIGHVITDSGSTTAVTGNVASTVADGADVTLGAKADAKSTATDTTPITAMSVWKQISASVQALVSALGSPFQAGGALGAGSALIGKVGIDQATVGTTDSVTVKSKTVYERVIYGTAQTVFNSSTDIAAGNFSAAGTDFTNNDATIGAVLYADAMIEMPDWAAAPVAGTTVDLYGLPINVDGTDDDTDAPSGTAAGGARYLGSWIVAAADALQRRTIPISLAGIQNGFTPYVINRTAQNMNNDGGTNMVLKITPWTVALVG